MAVNIFLLQANRLWVSRWLDIWCVYLDPLQICQVIMVMLQSEAEFCLCRVQRAHETLDTSLVSQAFPFYHMILTIVDSFSVIMAICLWQASLYMAIYLGCDFNL